MTPDQATRPDVTTRRAVARRNLPGLALVAAVAAMSLMVSSLVPIVSPLILAIVLGIVARNAGLLPAVARPGTQWSTKRLLRAGVVLLGLQLSLGEVLSLEVGELATIVATVAVTFLATRWVGARLGVSRTTSLLVATGFSICGASAIAAMSSVVQEDETTEDDVATSIAMVTLFGSLAIFVMPLLQGVAGLDDRQMGVWIGSSVHEVAQVVAAAAAVSTAALTVAVVVKLARVVLLAPMVAIVGATERRRATRAGLSGQDGAARPPLVPLFVLGFLAMVVVRSVDVVPDQVLEPAKLATTALLTAAMFGLGTGVHLATLRATGARAVALGAASTAIAATVSLTGIHLLT
ncbi:putative sulfate exporter family transporter [Georgenia sp. M64]|uniref:YeiH family protein n=1 Tax=Georgenia sp. M64 TaxID=3120520 RepID=UPI0030E3BAF2